MTERQIRDFRYRGLRIPEHMIGAVLRYFNDHALARRLPLRGAGKRLPWGLALC